MVRGELELLPVHVLSGGEKLQWGCKPGVALAVLPSCVSGDGFACRAEEIDL